MPVGSMVAHDARFEVRDSERIGHVEAAHEVTADGEAGSFCAVCCQW